MKKNTLIILVSIISYLPLLINAQTILLNETFELSTWALQYPSISYHNNCGSASGYAVYFQTQSGERWIKTYQLNVSEGGSIDFYFFMPLQDVGYCDAPDYGDDVNLEYSIDNGVSWKNLWSFWGGIDDYSSFIKKSFTIPQDAQTHSTLFRWIQPKYDHGDNQYSYDYWGLDNLQIISNSDCALTFFLGADKYNHISGISLNNMSNINNGFLSSTFYSDYTNISTSLNLNTSYSLTVNGSGSDYETFGAWIDYDNDGLFENSELLGEAKSNGGEATIVFTVPGSAKTGKSTLMVISQEDYTSNLDPCGFYNYGEAEEYGIVINSNSSGIVQNNF